jgi:hypothetical protein
MKVANAPENGRRKTAPSSSNYYTITLLSIYIGILSLSAVLLCCVWFSLLFSCVFVCLFFCLTYNQTPLGTYDSRTGTFFIYKQSAHCTLSLSLSLLFLSFRPLRTQQPKQVLRVNRVGLCSCVVANCLQCHERRRRSARQSLPVGIVSASSKMKAFSSNINVLSTSSAMCVIVACSPPMEWLFMSTRFTSVTSTSRYHWTTSFLLVFFSNLCSVVSVCVSVCLYVSVCLSVCLSVCMCVSVFSGASVVCVVSLNVGVSVCTSTILYRVPNALPGKDSVKHNIIGSQGAPPDGMCCLLYRCVPL